MTEEDFINTKKENKRLCNEYPFLIPSNRWSGKRINSKEPGFWPGAPEEIPEWDYEYTELDDMPSGWRKAFGEQMCKEIKEALPQEKLDDYRIIQIKEKWGELRWYDNWSTEKLMKIENKYTHISRYTCIKCGKPATKITRGWISPYCDNCVPDFENSIPINEYYKD